MNIKPTILASYIRNLKQKNVDYDIHWSVVGRASAIKDGDATCRLCLKEATTIAFAGAGCINQRSEIANRCMHKRKFLLNFVCAPDWFVMFSLFWFFKKRVRLNCFYRYFVAISFPFSCVDELPARSYASNHLRRFLAWSSRPPLIFPVFFHFFFFLMRAASISSCRCLVSLVSCHWTFWGSLSRETLSKSRLLKHLCVFIYIYIYISNYNCKSNCQVTLWVQLRVV